MPSIQSQTPKKGDCLSFSIFSSMLLVMSITWFFYDCYCLTLLLLPCGVHYHWTVIHSKEISTPFQSTSLKSA